MTAFEAINADHRRIPTAPARNYEAQPEVEDDLLPPPAAEQIPPGLIPVLAAPVSKKTRATLRKMKAFATLEAAASEEGEMQQLAAKFSREAARASHKAAMEQAIEAGDAEMIAAMPSEAELVAKNEAAHKQIRERIRRIRVSVADDLEKVTTKAIELIVAERAEAEGALLELYRNRGLSEPIPAAIGDSYTRRCQESRNYTQIFRAGGAAIAPMLVELG